MKWFKTAVIILTVALISIFSDAWAQTALRVSPIQTVLSPALIKTPISFSGSGFNAKEVVTIELVVPEGMKIKGLEPDEDRVGIAFATADEKGDFRTKMSPLSTLNWFFQVGWVLDKTENVKPSFKDATPLPPGIYKILATGIISQKVGKATLSLLAPPKKK